MKPFVFTRRHEDILREIALCRYLRREQVRERFFGKGSGTYAWKLLTELVKQGYVRPYKKVGQVIYYGLAKKGVALLRRTGTRITYTPSEHAPQDSSQFRHLAATNDIAIAVMKLPVNYTVVERRHYISNRQEKTGAIPDLWVHLLIGDKAGALWVELDRHSEEEEYIRRKVRTILAFIFHGYMEEFGVELVSVAFLTTGGDTHLQKMLRWIEKELTASGNSQYGEFFKLTCIEEGIISPEIFREYHRWCVPFSSTTAALL